MHRIADYALLGDCHSAALVSLDGSVDWACFPAFDAPAVFARILDADHGGSFTVQPRDRFKSRRAYLEGTNVLATTFECGDGVLEVTDCMPLEPGDPARPSTLTSHHALLRRVRCLEGQVEVRVTVAPRFEYGAFVPRFRLVDPDGAPGIGGVADIVGGADALRVVATRRLEATRERLKARWTLAAGEEAYVQCAWHRAHEDPEPVPGAAELARRLETTVGYWRAWSARGHYDGDHPGQVRRSALVLKALTYAPTGAVVAAPTTSLPEAVGGGRNWDYRYTWIRDATLTLTSLYVLGYRAEADAFKRWIQRTGAGRPEDIQIMYGIDGRRALPEVELGHLAGHRGSRPVRVGNGAVKQMQLDAYGQFMEAAWLYPKLGGDVSANWKFLRHLTDLVAERWHDADHGIWEIRDTPRHFVHSKLHCWVALDRALRIAKDHGLPAPGRWVTERDAVRDALLAEADRVGWFPQALGHEVADASVLLVPAMGLLPPDDPRVLATLDRVRAELEDGGGGLLHRYRAEDGLAGGEGAFLLCSFWLVDALAHAGRLAEAEAIFDRLLRLANDVGLYAEEAEPATGEALGNFPQAFTHMALVTSSAHLSAGRRGELPRLGAYDFTERLLDAAVSRPGV